MTTRRSPNFAYDPSARKKKAGAVVEAAPEATADGDGSAAPGHVAIEASARSKVPDKSTQSRGVIKHRVDDCCQARQAHGQGETIEKKKDRHRAGMKGSSVLPRRFGAQLAARPVANQSGKMGMKGASVLPRRFGARLAARLVANQSAENRMAKRRHAPEDTTSTSTGDTSRTRLHQAVWRSSSSSGRRHKRWICRASQSSRASGHSRTAKEAWQPRSSSSRSGGCRLKRRTSQCTATSRSSSSSASNIKRRVQRDRRSQSASSSRVSGHKRKTKTARPSGTTSMVSSRTSAVGAKRQRRSTSMCQSAAAATSGGLKDDLRWRAVRLSTEPGSQLGQV